MEEWIQKFSDLIAGDRTWSWCVIGILYIILTLIIRNWFLHPFVKRARELKHRWYQDLKDLYLKRATAGWIFYIISLVTILVLWSRPQIFPLTVGRTIAIVVALCSYILSIVFHLQALSVATVVTLRRVESK